MKLDDVKKGLRVTITHLWPPNSFSVVQKNLDCRKEGVTGVVIGHVPGHGGDVWWVKHDGTNDVGAYRFTEFETIDHDLVPAYSVLENVIDERNALRDEVAELKRKLAEVEGERDALRKCGSKLHLTYDLNSIQNITIALNDFQIRLNEIKIQYNELVLLNEELKGALSFYVAICGNTGYSLDRESAMQAYSRAKAVISKVDKLNSPVK